MESLITTLAPFLKVLFAFVIMLAGMRFKVGLGLSILMGGAVMGFMFGLAPVPLAKASVMALTQEKFHFLIAIVGLILILSDAMERSGQSKRLMSALSGFLTSPRLRLIFFQPLSGCCLCLAGLSFPLPWLKQCLKTCESAILIEPWSIIGFDMCGNWSGRYIPVLS